MSRVPRRVSKLLTKKPDDHGRPVPVTDDGREFAMRIRRGIALDEQRTVMSAFGPKVTAWIDATGAGM